MQEPQSTPVEREAVIAEQEREFLSQLKHRSKQKNKLPHTFGNRKERRRLEAQVRGLKK